MDAVIQVLLLSGYSESHVADGKINLPIRHHKKAPAGDLPTEQVMAKTFSLANLEPEAAKHNGGAWAKTADVDDLVVRFAHSVSEQAPQSGNQNPITEI